LGEVAGWYGNDWFTTNARAFYWDTEQVIELGVLDGSVQSAAFSINDNSDIVGISRAPHPDGGMPPQSFYWNGQMSQIGWPPGYSTNAVHAISNHGQIVGNTGTPGSSTAAYLAQLPDLEALTLNELTGDIDLTAAHDVNDFGRILTISSTKSVLLTAVNVPFADLNFDCDVGGDDLQLLLNQWSPVRRSLGGSDSPNRVLNADLNSDGVVDGHDLLILLASWG